MSNANLEKLIERREKLDAQIRAKRASVRAKQSKQQRKDDTRRKIITGALALEHASKNPDSEFGRVILRLLKEYVPDRDRHLFDFPNEQSSTPNDNATSFSINGLSASFTGTESGGG